MDGKRFKRAQYFTRTSASLLKWKIKKRSILIKNRFNKNYFQKFENLTPKIRSLMIKLKKKIRLNIEKRNLGLLKALDGYNEKRKDILRKKNSFGREKNFHQNVEHELFFHVNILFFILKNLSICEN